jgi:uncharacterized membrane-anchored protein
LSNPEFAPPAVEDAAEGPPDRGFPWLWLAGRERDVLFAAVAFQLLVLVGMIVWKVRPVLTGQTVLLRVIPLDPRDLMRGDYVILSYEFSRFPPQSIAGVSGSNDWQGRTVYVSLVPDPDGRHVRAGGFSTEPPASGLFLQGTVSNGNTITYGIESFFVQEGTGKDYEQAARDGRLSAEVAIDRHGQAVVRRLVLD